jgi:hypothetical protein
VNGGQAQQWSGAALAAFTLLCFTVLLVMHPQIVPSEAVAVVYVGVGLRATGLVAHALGVRAQQNGKDDSK